MAKKETKRSKRDIKTQKALDQKFKDNGFDDTSDEVFGNETIIKMNVGKATVDYSCLFGANKNLYRITPRLQDGLKPGAGRLLYMWWLRDGRLQSTKPEVLRRRKFYKVARLSTDTMAIHPHGDSGIVELIGRLGQPWSNNIMLLVPQGSFGNQRGDQSGAGRYIEAMMSEFTIDCFFSDYDKYCIPEKTVYDGSMEEPEFLPAKYPYVLFNPQFSSIGLTHSSPIKTELIAGKSLS